MKVAQVLRAVLTLGLLVQVWRGVWWAAPLVLTLLWLAVEACTLILRQTQATTLAASAAMLDALARAEATAARLEQLADGVHLAKQVEQQVQRNVRIYG